MELSFQNLLRVLRNGIVIMIISALVCAGASYCFSSLFISKTYKTTIKLYVETDSRAEDSYNDLNSYRYATSLVNTYIEMLETNNFYSRVAQSIDGEYTMGKIATMVSFSNESETEVFNATVIADTPEEAKKVADAVSDIAPLVLSELNDNADLKIVDRAIMPVAPASPNVGKNTAMALVFGFAGAFLYLFIKDILDVKFKYNCDMGSYKDIPILAAIPDFDNEKFSATYYFSKEMQEADIPKEAR